MEGACQVSCILNQVQFLNNKAKEENSGVYLGKSGKTLGKLHDVTGFSPRHWVATAATEAAAAATATENCSGDLEKVFSRN